MLKRNSLISVWWESWGEEGVRPGTCQSQDEASPCILASSAQSFLIQAFLTCDKLQDGHAWQFWQHGRIRWGDKVVASELENTPNEVERGGRSFSSITVVRAIPSFWNKLTRALTLRWVQSGWVTSFCQSHENLKNPRVLSEPRRRLRRENLRFRKTHQVKRCWLYGFIIQKPLKVKHGH